MLKCFTASCRQATAPRRPWWNKLESEDGIKKQVYFLRAKPRHIGTTVKTVKTMSNNIYIIASCLIAENLDICEL